MSTAPLIIPPGSLPHGAPQGLNDLLWNPPATAAEIAQQALAAGWQHHAPLWIGLGIGLLLLVALGWQLAQDWRGRLLRWQLKRLARLMQRRPDTLPEPVGAALHWALAQYFRQRPGLARTALPPAWHAAVRRLDALRFSGHTATPADWLALFTALRALSLQTAAAPVAGART